MERSWLVFILLLCALPSQAAMQMYYLHNDHLGTPRVVTDNDQQIVWKGHPKPFGEMQVEIESITNHRRFPGQRFDIESRLYYNYFRDYDPSIGRYIQSDPIGLYGGVNTYAYVGGNPINLADPKGLWATYVHTRAGYLAFGKEISRAQLKLVADAQFYADSAEFQLIDMSYRHAMSAPNQTDACQKAINFVQDQFDKARKLKSSGNFDKALWEFAIGLHTLQDSTSPSHQGFQVWEGNAWYHPHSLKHGMQELIDPNPFTSKLDRMTQNAWEAFKNNASPPSMECGCGP